MPCWRGLCACGMSNGCWRKGSDFSERSAIFAILNRGRWLGFVLVLDDWVGLGNWACIYVCVCDEPALFLGRVGPSQCQVPSPLFFLSSFVFFFLLILYTWKRAERICSSVIYRCALLSLLERAIIYILFFIPRCSGRRAGRAFHSQIASMLFRLWLSRSSGWP